LGKHARVLRAVSRFISTPDELYLELDEDASEFVLIESPEEVKAEVDRVKVVETLTELGDATSTTIAEEVELPDATVRRHLNTLLEQGHVARDGKGKRGDPFRWRIVSTDRTDRDEVKVA
jgi:transcription initiation factor IIE alpha subunit